MYRTLICCCVLFVPAMSRGADIAVDILPDVVYGHKDGLAMTYDVFTPKQNSNGAGVLFMVSGGWYSGWTPPEQARPFFEPLTNKGFTVFSVRHGSSPKYSIPDAVSDVRRSVRHIRLNATKYGVDPNRLGVFGMSAGGHLSLMLGTTADEGSPDDKDPVQKVSDRVQAVVAFVAPTDLTIMVKAAPDRLPAYRQFPALDLEIPLAKLNSPLLQVTADDTPILLLAGVKDDLVPIDHSRKIKEELIKQKVANKLIEFENSGHGLIPDDMKLAVAEMVMWFETYLAAK